MSRKNAELLNTKQTQQYNRTIEEYTHYTMKMSPNSALYVASVLLIMKNFKQ